jgi:hypothetical protein
VGDRLNVSTLELLRELIVQGSLTSVRDEPGPEELKDYESQN